MKVVLRSLVPGRNSQAWGSQVDQGTFHDSESIKAHEKLPYELDNGHRRSKRTRRTIKALAILRYLGLEAWALCGSSGLPGALCGFPGALLYSVRVLLTFFWDSLGSPGTFLKLPWAPWVPSLVFAILVF